MPGGIFPKRFAPASNCCRSSGMEVSSGDHISFQAAFKEMRVLDHKNDEFTFGAGHTTFS